MLRTTIQTTDEETGKELPIPPDLRAKVQRAADTLAEVLRKVGEKFDIKARWYFDRGPGQDFEVWLSLWAEGMEGKGILFPFPRADLQDAQSTRRTLWKPIGFIIPPLSEQVDRDFARIRRDLDALVATPVGTSEE
jgi:hypothetical protein